MLHTITKAVSFFLILFIAATSSVDAGQPKLSPEAQVSLLTTSSGAELYTLFGHTALRIYDPEAGVDRAYNYGTFDFNAPGFYWKFALGDLRYFLSVNKFENAKSIFE